MKILISGFEPFGDLMKNPTEELAKAASTWEIEGVTITTVVLPVVYKECAERLLEEVNRIKPDVVLSLGVAVGRAGITPERIGINVQHTEGEGKFGDNTGYKPTNKPLVPEGPDGLFSTLPIEEMARKLTESGIPARISNTAGTYICNNTLYEVALFAKKQGNLIKTGFVHVPATPEMVVSSGAPSMDISLQEKALRLMIEAIRDSR
ncbi:pyroglutamyl-peptidase I [Alteribacter keqinensis]|uniref:Pyroglutamyl-peptidase I n=1 Tax=Alteribacter keqinensis TaxID=2483800 RepID=A0A3M7TXW0_9BACI|nr:pyroglutamyl-peptidase I [Alteribacter keqinensis]RNA70109.1 pyroglutamyl-peptidase I [Alteribacter keqinensis]